MSEKETVQLMIKIPKDLREKFKKISMLNDTTMADLLRDYIEDYVSKFENPRPQKKRIRVKKKVGDNSAEVKKAENNSQEN